jgi:hypothetical protein
MLWSGHRPAAVDDEGSIFLSKDEGNSWTRVDAGIPPGAAINGWINIPGGVMVSTEDHGIYTAQDELKTWYPANHGLPANLKIKTLATHGGSVFAGSYLHGIYVSHDAGNSWQKSSEGLGERSVRCLYSLGNTLYAGADRGIYHSTDNGLHWSLATQGMQINDFTSWGGILYAATNYGMLRTGAGQSWIWLYPTMALFNISADDGVISSILPDGEVYTCIAGGDRGVILTPPFNRYTFLLTPTSSPLLRTPWLKDLRPLRTLGSFKGRGLPENKPLQKILKTPFGILVAAGNSKQGC